MPDSGERRKRCARFVVPSNWYQSRRMRRTDRTCSITQPLSTHGSARKISPCKIWRRPHNYQATSLTADSSCCLGTIRCAVIRASKKSSPRSRRRINRESSRFSYLLSYFLLLTSYFLLLTSCFLLLASCFLLLISVL